ncbi:MAG: hypothetical protein P8129_11450 [Anaerolineae bacterium]
MDEQLRRAITGSLREGKLGCSEAHAIATQMGLEPLAVGQAADALDIRIFRCQLGLFGYGPKSEGKHKIVHPMDDVPERLAARLRAAAGAEGITCLDIWQIADELGYLYLEASSAVEAMGLRVSRCQLGCFPRA